MRYTFLLLASLLVVGLGRVGSAQEQPFDLLQKAWTPYLSENDPFAFPLKVTSMCSNVQHFWGGGKDLFLEWCRTHAADWLADPSAYITQQGDPNFGNIGTYLAEEEFGSIGFGLTDFDESCRLPLQIELLQGVISLRMVASQGRNKIRLDPRQVEELARLMADHYKLGASSTRSATRLLKDNDIVRKMMKSAAKENYSEDLAQYTDGQGHFRRNIEKDGEVKEILRPIPDRADQMAEGLAAAMRDSKRMRRLFRAQDAASIRATIKDVALRTHLGIAGSQGVRKYLVLMDKPLKEVDHDVIIYLKEQVPSAAQRTGLAIKDTRPAGERCAADIELLSNPRPYIAGWCQVGQESYLITLKHPCVKEVDSDEAKDYADLLQLARVWGTAVGASHRQRGEVQMIAQRIDQKLVEDLVSLSDAYMVQMIADYQVLRSDARTRQLMTAARAATSAQAEK